MLPIRPGSLRALAQPFIQRAVREGLNARQTIDTLHAGGLRFRRQDMLADYRHYAQRDRLSSPLRSIRLDRLPSRSLMTEARTHQSQRYKYTLEIRLRGQAEPRFRSISTSRRLTRGDAIRTATELGRGYGDWASESDIEDADLYAVDVAE